ncbi:hypothetical protein [Rhizobium leguminosarum]|uniref:hypothetical protein n=1 Tax=Rhizobium leguminosarum TaxID=384 RepID=UPI001C974C74|nr:hypothetical protein [Rhizobium leguminosarum]MBY5441782.1 hypothetical protein [Rhizobium leguminosarum]
MAHDRIPPQLHELAASLQAFAFHRSLKGPPTGTFRSDTARDVASILEVNPDVAWWNTSAPQIETTHGDHLPDFEMSDVGGVRWLLDAPDRKSPIDGELLVGETRLRGFRYRVLSRDEIYDGFRLRNARDLLRYTGHNVPLGDRVRVLAALDENGSLALSELLGAVRETQPVAALASMILRGFVEVELDDALIGPETQVRRIRG